jgi:hypothetical protein
MATPDGYTELRVDIPDQLASLLDAVLMAKFGKNGKRADIVVPVLAAMVDKEVHEATVLLRCARINPLAAEPTGKSFP